MDHHHFCGGLKQTNRKRYTTASIIVVVIRSEHAYITFENIQKKYPLEMAGEHSKHTARLGLEWRTTATYDEQIWRYGTWQYFSFWFVICFWMILQLTVGVGGFYTYNLHEFVVKLTTFGFGLTLRLTWLQVFVFFFV